MSFCGKYTMDEELKNKILSFPDGYPYGRIQKELGTSHRQIVRVRGPSKFTSGQQRAISEEVLSRIKSYPPEIGARQISDEMDIDERTVRKYRSSPTRGYKSRCKTRVFTENDVRYIRASAESAKSLAKYFEVSVGTIYGIRRGLWYRWVRNDG